MFSILVTLLAATTVFAAPTPNYDYDYDEDQSDAFSVEIVPNQVEQLSPTSTLLFEALQTITFGSGSKNWESEYDDCVSQCFDQYGSSSPSQTQQEAAIHTIVVIPDGEYVRYVPFAVNASVGDIIKFRWNDEDTHELSFGDGLCGEGQSVQSSNGFYDYIVESTSPQFFFSSSCSSGTWGLINPSLSQDSNVGSLFSSILSNPNTLNAYSYLLHQSSSSWGFSISSDSLPEDQLLQNVLFTQMQMAANPNVIEFNPNNEPLRVVRNALTLLSNSNQDPGENLGAPNGTRTGAAPTITGLEVVPVSAATTLTLGWWTAVLGLVGLLVLVY